jgi:hypothetical protein
MNRDLKPNRSGLVSQAGTTNSQGALCRRIDAIRGVTLESRIINADRIFGATQAVRELIEETFGKTEIRRKSLTPDFLATKSTAADNNR